MHGLPVEITPLGDLLMWGGIAFLGLLLLVSILVPRRWRRNREAL